MKISEYNKLLMKFLMLILFCILFAEFVKSQSPEELFIIPQYPINHDTVYLISKINLGPTDSIVVNINNFEIVVFAYYGPTMAGFPIGYRDTTKIGVLTNGDYILYFIGQRFSGWIRPPKIRIIEFTVKDSNLILQEKNPDNLISVYPNPAKDIIGIQNNYNLVLQSIDLHDINGRIIKTFCTSSTTLDISDIAKGQYILNIQTDKGEFVEKIIIQ